MNNRKKIDIVILIIIPIISSLIALILKTNTLVGIILVYGVPSFYLSIRSSGHVLKSAIFSAIVGLPLMIIIDYISHYSGIWKMYETSFPIRIFGYVTLEMLLWAFLQVYYVIMFYEYFLDLQIEQRKYKKFILQKMKYLIAGIVIILLSFITLFIGYKKVLNIPYFYDIFGVTLTLIPSIVFLLKFPRLIKRFILIQIYFFLHSFLVEFVGLKLGIWDFPGDQFLGWINIIGVRFPFEEFFYWMLLMAIAVLSFYEYFDDDTK